MKNSVLDILFEDNDLIVINKPAGVVVHPGTGNCDNTLMNNLVNYDKNLRKIPRAGIIHRLDKETSGLLIVARKIKSFDYLIRAIQNRKIKREYEAILCGNLITGGLIDKPIARDNRNREFMKVSKYGRRSITNYRIIRRFLSHTFVRIRLETGRKHQIRVHFESIGHPILGDKIYNKNNRSCVFFGDFNVKPPRQALHAKKISFLHPSNGKLVSLSAKLPNDITNILQILGSR